MILGRAVTAQLFTTSFTANALKEQVPTKTAVSGTFQAVVSFTSTQHVNNDGKICTVTAGTGFCDNSVPVVTGSYLKINNKYYLVTSVASGRYKYLTLEIVE